MLGVKKLVFNCTHLCQPPGPNLPPRFSRDPLPSIHRELNLISCNTSPIDLINLSEDSIIFQTVDRLGFFRIETLAFIGLSQVMGLSKVWVIPFLTFVLSTAAFFVS